MLEPAPIILASLLAGFVPACTTDADDPIEAPDKLELLSGKVIDLHELEEIQPALQDGRYQDLLDQASVKVHADDASIVPQRTWRFDAQNWPEAKTLYVAVHATDHTGDVSFGLLDANQLRPIRCLGVDEFRSIAINSRAGIIDADGKTFTFDDCELDPMSPALTVFPIPVAHGARETQVRYRLDARVE